MNSYSDRLDQWTAGAVTFCAVWGGIVSMAGVATLFSKLVA